MKIPELLNRARELNNQKVRVEGKLIQNMHDEAFYLASETTELKLLLADTPQKLPRPQAKRLDERTIADTLEASATRIIEQNPLMDNADLISNLRSGSRIDIWKLFIEDGAKELLEEHSPFTLQLPYMNSISQLRSYLYFPGDSLDTYFTYAFDAELEGRIVFDGDKPKLLNIEEIRLISASLRRYFFNKEPNLDEIKMAFHNITTVEEILNNQPYYHQKTIRLSGILVGHTSSDNDFYVVPSTSYGWLNKTNRKILAVSVQSEILVKHLETSIGSFRHKLYNYLYLVNIVGDILAENSSQQATITNLKEFAILTPEGIFHWELNKN